MNFLEGNFALLPGLEGDGFFSSKEGRGGVSGKKKKKSLNGERSRTENLRYNLISSLASKI